MDVKKEFGKKLKEIRSSRKMSQEELSELAQINQQQISKIERGLSFVTPETLERIAKALDVNIKLLFDFEYKENKIKSDIELELSRMSMCKLKQIREIALIINKYN